MVYTRERDHDHRVSRVEVKAEAASERTDSPEVWDTNRIGQEFLPLETFRPRMESLAQRFPGLVYVYPVGVLPNMTSYEGRDIPCMRVSTTPEVNDPRKAEVVLSGLFHAREWIAAEVTLQVAERLVEAYYTNAKVRALLQRVEIIVLPMMNPDGYLYSWGGTQQHRLWRKNRRPLGDGYYGVDLNRNFPYQWGQQVTWRGAETYPGTSPASEPEVQGFISLLANTDVVSDIALFLSYHNYGREILWPYGYKVGGPHSAVSDLLIELFSTARTSMTFGIDGSVPYTSKNAAGSYPVSGDTVDYVHLTYDLVPSATIELRGNGDTNPWASNGYDLQVDKINTTVLENFALLCSLIDNHVGAVTKGLAKQTAGLSLTHQKWWAPFSSGQTNNKQDVMATINYDKDTDGVSDYVDPCVNGDGSGGGADMALFTAHRAEVRQQNIGLGTMSGWWWGVESDSRGRRSCAQSDPPSVYWKGSTSRPLFSVFLVPKNDGTSDDDGVWQACRVGSDAAPLELSLLASARNLLPAHLKDVISSVTVELAGSDGIVDGNSSLHGAYQYCTAVWSFTVTDAPPAGGEQQHIGGAAQNIDDVFVALTSQIGLTYDARVVQPQSGLSYMITTQSVVEVPEEGGGATGGSRPRYLAVTTDADFIFPLWCYLRDGRDEQSNDVTTCETDARTRYVLRQAPAAEPTTEPTFSPSEEPTMESTENPTSTPTSEPNSTPMSAITNEPTSLQPTFTPSEEPTMEPTGTPIATAEPTATTREPAITDEPTTLQSTFTPTVEPTMESTGTGNLITAAATQEPEPTSTPTSEQTSEPTSSTPISAITDEPTTIQPTVVDRTTTDQPASEMQTPVMSAMIAVVSTLCCFVILVGTALVCWCCRNRSTTAKLKHYQRMKALSPSMESDVTNHVAADNVTLYPRSRVNLLDDNTGVQQQGGLAPPLRPQCATTPPPPPPPAPHRYAEAIENLFYENKEQQPPYSSVNKKNQRADPLQQQQQRSYYYHAYQEQHSLSHWRMMPTKRNDRAGIRPPPGGSASDLLYYSRPPPPPLYYGAPDGDHYHYHHGHREREWEP